MAKSSFRANATPSGRGRGHLDEVPSTVVEALGGGGRAAVAATFNGVPYRGSIVRMGGMSVLGVQKAIMAEAGIVPGDEQEVVVEKDEARAKRIERTMQTLTDEVSR